DACTTRLRLTVRDSALIDDAALRRLGARGVLRPSREAVQVVLGPQADIVAGELRTALRERGVQPVAPVPAPAVAATAASPVAATVAFDAAAWLAALGGRANVTALAAVAATRLRVALRDPARVDADALRRLGVLGTVAGADASLQLIVGRAAPQYATVLQSA
ncbi:MAG: PTS transporter subunit EIIB, partial [Solimonas sp.]